MSIKVLIVDDFKDTRDSLRITLENIDSAYEIAEAKDAKECYAWIRDSKPDVILMDIMLPDEDGIHVVEELAKAAKLEGVKVIFITAKTDPQTRLEGQLVGDDFVVKPFSVDVINRKIKALVSKK